MPSCYNQETQTSWLKETSSPPYFSVALVFENTGVNPSVLLLHIEDTQHEAGTGFFAEFEVWIIHSRMIHGTVSIVVFAQILEVAMGGIASKPVHRITGGIDTVALNHRLTGDWRIKYFYVVLQQDLPWICRNKHTNTKVLEMPLIIH